MEPQIQSDGVQSGGVQSGGVHSLMVFSLVVFSLVVFRQRPLFTDGDHVTMSFRAKCITLSLSRMFGGLVFQPQHMMIINSQWEHVYINRWKHVKKHSDLKVMMCTVTPLLVPAFCVK